MTALSRCTSASSAITARLLMLEERNCIHCEALPQKVLKQSPADVKPHHAGNAYADVKPHQAGNACLVGFNISIEETGDCRGLGNSGHHHRRKLMALVLSAWRPEGI